MVTVSKTRTMTFPLSHKGDGSTYSLPSEKPIYSTLHIIVVQATQSQQIELQVFVRNIKTLQGTIDID